MNAAAASTKVPPRTRFAIKFLYQLEMNEGRMGQQAALAVTLETFGFQGTDVHRLADLMQVVPETDWWLMLPRDELLSPADDEEKQSWGLY